MAHELSIRENGFVEMAFVGETPWHNLGQDLEEDATIETWSVAAGMDWEVQKALVEYTPEDNLLTAPFPGQNVLYRSDTNAPLGIVSDRYNIVQPIEVLEFFRDLVDENGFKLRTAGTLFGGKRFWALAETGNFGEVCKDDGIGGFLLLSSSCDRSLATTARFTTIRVVCNNTLSAACGSDANTVSFNHLTAFDHKVIKQQLGEAVASFGTFMGMAQALQAQKLGIVSADVFLSNLLLPTIQGVDESYDISGNRAYCKILSLFNGEAKGAELVGQTKWGMLNAVTEYYDHWSPSRANENRLNSAWFGSGAKIKDRAVELLAMAA